MSLLLRSKLVRLSEAAGGPAAIVGQCIISGHLPIMMRRNPTTEVSLPVLTRRWDSHPVALGQVLAAPTGRAAGAVVTLAAVLQSFVLLLLLAVSVAAALRYL